MTAANKQILAIGIEWRRVQAEIVVSDDEEFMERMTALQDCLADKVARLRPTTAAAALEQLDLFGREGFNSRRDFAMYDSALDALRRLIPAAA
jgi:hypothetical protein